MSLLPDTDRILLGPGPSLTSPRVMRAMMAPTVRHLDPLMIRMLDDVRERLRRVFAAPDGSLALAISGTGTSGMEATVADLVGEGTRVLARTSVCGRSMPSVYLRALTKARCENSCSMNSTSKSAPGSAPWPGKSGGWA